jgi:hypothetical protein
MHGLPRGFDESAPARVTLTAALIASGVAEFREDATDFSGNEDLRIDQGNRVRVSPSPAKWAIYGIR